LACRVWAAKNWRWARRVGSSTPGRSAPRHPPSDRRRSHAIQATGARWKEVRYLSGTSRLSKPSPTAPEPQPRDDMNDGDDDDDDDDRPPELPAPKVGA
jgi:hypothetical protein